MSAVSSSDASSKMSATAAKSTKASKTTAAVAAPAPVAAAAPAVVAETKAKGGKKAAAAPVAAAAPAPAVAAPAPAVTEAAAPAVEEDVATKLAKAVTRQAEIAHQQKTLAVEAVANAKEIEKLSARLAKKAGRRKRTGAANPNSGKAFITPIPITNDLCAFLGLEKGSSISRAEVTKRVHAYAKAHGLQQGKVINTDASLRKLLGVTEKDEVTTLNLQKYINVHYIKATPAVAAN
jgi:chromatin remodeling complex protein RSC6